MPYQVPTAKTMGAPTKQEADRAYDQSRRDRRAHLFYMSARWRKVRQMQLNRNPCCAECFKEDRLTPASIAHHSLGLGEDYEHALRLETLVSLCAHHHSKLHASERNADATA